MWLCTARSGRGRVCVWLRSFRVVWGHCGAYRDYVGMGRVCVCVCACMRVCVWGRGWLCVGCSVGGWCRMGSGGVVALWGRVGSLGRGRVWSVELVKMGRFGQGRQGLADRG